MQISALRHFLVHPPSGKNLLFVALDTDEGLTGWGECYTQADRDIQVVAHLDQLERYVLGRDLTDVMYNDFAARRGAMDYYSAISGLEQAMWDLQGQRLGAPVHELLGGRVRDRIRVYANGWARSGSHEELAASACAVVDRGFTAMKFDPVPGPWRTFISREQEREAIERVRIVREAVGPDIEIVVEIHRRLAPMHAIRVARGVEKFAPYWFEEPVLAENIDALAAARREINIPVVTGEELYTKHEFRAVFEQQAADIINPRTSATSAGSSSSRRSQRWRSPTSSPSRHITTTAPRSASPPRCRPRRRCPTSSSPSTS